MPERALGEDGRLRGDVRARLEVRKRLVVLAAALVTRAHAAHDPFLDEELGRGGLGEDVCARLLRPLAEKATKLGDRDHVVAVVAEVRGHRLQGEGLLRGEQVDRVLLHLPENRPLRLGEVREELLHRGRAHVRPREQMRTRCLALLDHGDRDLAKLLGELGLVLEQLHDLDCAGEPGRAAADDRHADLDPLLFGVGGLADELLRRLERRRILGRGDHLGALLRLYGLGQLRQDLV